MDAGAVRGMVAFAQLTHRPTRRADVANAGRCESRQMGFARVTSEASMKPGPKLLRLTETNAKQRWKITQPDLRKLRRLKMRAEESLDAFREFESELLHR